MLLWHAPTTVLSTPDPRRLQDHPRAQTCALLHISCRRVEALEQRNDRATAPDRRKVTIWKRTGMNLAFVGA